MKRYWLNCLVIMFVFMANYSLFAQQTNNNYDPDLFALKSAAPEGIGPLSLPYLHQVPMGYAFVYGSKQPDLFVAGRNKVEGLYLYRWLKNSSSGVPIFDKPVKINSPYATKGHIFQAEDGVIHGIWLLNKEVIHLIFDLQTLSFTEKNRILVVELPSNPLNITALPLKGGNYKLVFEISGASIPGKYGNQNPSTEAWRPYDEAGISSLPKRYTYLYEATLNSIDDTKVKDVQQLSRTNKETFFNMMQITTATLGNKQGVLAGGRLGNFTFYDMSTEYDLADKVFAVDRNEILLRHPTVGSCVCAYPFAKGGNTNLIVGGEGALFFYQFTGKFTAKGYPIFEDPEHVLQVDADLYAGTLPTPSVVDWDGDGIDDLVVGNSAGNVLFFKNIGTQDEPAFLPGEKVKAGGEYIHIQAGYSGSVQGAQEARWGYLSPNVIDWTGDGLPDIVMGDITGSYTVYINEGTKTNPVLASARAIYCDGMNLHGMWRSRAAVGKIDGEQYMVIVDEEDNLSYYRKIDNYNVQNMGKVKMSDGSDIVVSADPAGGTGRCKLDFFDWDDDGELDLVIGTGRRSAIPNMKTGYPLPILGKKTMGVPMVMKNVSNKPMIFEHPFAFKYPTIGLVQPGGPHESGAVGTTLGGGNKKNLLVGNEIGRLYLLKGEKLSPITIEEASKYREKPNPFPNFPHFGSVAK